MFVHVLPGAGKSVLESLMPVVQEFYLAGGTGMALQLGHRVSGDLDFFSPHEFQTDQIREQITRIGQFKLVSEARGTLHGILNRTKISLLSYRYPLLFPTRDLEGVAVADYHEIALMKITAISSRGSKKDFVDLFFACRELSLDKLLTMFKRKYGETKFSEYHIIKSLAFFDDAENEPDPIMLKPWDWEKIKVFFRKEAVRMAQMIK